MYFQIRSIEQLQTELRNSTSNVWAFENGEIWCTDYENPEWDDWNDGKYEDCEEWIAEHLSESDDVYRGNIMIAYSGSPLWRLLSYREEGNTLYIDLS